MEIVVLLLDDCRSAYTESIKHTDSGKTSRNMGSDPADFLASPAVVGKHQGAQNDENRDGRE